MPELAPARFARWLAKNNHVDKSYGHVYRYHPRSDAHSIALCTEVLRDMIVAVPLLEEQAARGDVVYGINVEVTSPVTGKSKTLDLALGTPETVMPSMDGGIARSAYFRELLFSCEAKSVMTEHGKSKPRVYDELSSSHEIVHQGWPKALAGGITIVNMAKTYVSPTRQKSKSELEITKHTQPRAGEGMVKHLRGLKIRDEVGQVGFDVYATIVLECDNQCNEVTLWSDPPAPRPEDPEDRMLISSGRPEAGG